MKRGLNLFLTFALVMGGCFSTVFTINVNAESVNVLTFSYNGMDSYYVSECSSDASGDLEIPSTYRGLPVREIAAFAFENCISLTSVTIPDSITSIGYRAFCNCTSLTSVTIPDSITSIEHYAFDDCSNLNAVYISDLGSWCNIFFCSEDANPLYYAKNLYLNGNLVTDLVIPQGVTKIKKYAFEDCITLTSITLPNSVTSIGSSAFEGCTSLTSITIPDSVASIGLNAFYSCSKLNTVYITDLTSWCNIDFVDSYANPLCYAKNLYLNGNLVTELIIPEFINKINDYAFYNCTSLTSVTIPDSVKSIGYAAFEECSNLNAVYITDLTSWCNIDFVDSYANPLCYAKNLYLNGNLVTELIIPESITEIKDYAFYNCTSLTSVTIPDSVINIGDYSFAGCHALSSITIPDSVTEINYASFGGCASLSSIIIPVSITSIDGAAFGNCTSLTSITIPDSVISIGDYAFFKCELLENITIADSVTSIGVDAFTDTAYYNNNSNWENEALYIGNNLIEVKKEITGVFEIEKGTKTIAKCAFYNCSSLTSITIGNDVTSIGAGAFYNCYSLTSITIPDSVTSIGPSAFEECSNLNAVYITDLTSWCNIDFGSLYSNPLYYAKNLYLNDKLVTELVIPEGVTTINDHAFEYCNSLTSVLIPNSVISIGYEAFKGCTSLTSVTIGESVQNIGSSVFSKCESLTSVTIPNSVTHIGNYAFCDCKLLANITIPDSVTSIGYDVFNHTTYYNNNSNWENEALYIGNHLIKVKTSLSGDFIIKNGIRCIAGSAFSRCELLTSVTIPNTVTGIGTSAFLGCTALTNLTLPDSVKSIGYRSFFYCTSLVNVTIPDSVTNIGEEAFYDCYALKYVFYTGSVSDWENISVDSYNEKLLSASIHYNSTDHTYIEVVNDPIFEGVEGTREEVCEICGHVGKEEKIEFLNEYLAGVTTFDVALNEPTQYLSTNISASKDLNESIVAMDGYTLTTTPNSEYGYYGTGSKVQVTDTTGTQVAEYTLVVRGDVNGDSVCDGIDLMLIELARHTSNNVSLEGAYFAAANLAEDNEIDIDDFNAVVNKALI